MIIKIDADLADIVPEFLNKRRNDMPVLWEALQQKDFATITTLGHRLKGNAGGYGFDQMGLLGATIEIAATEKNVSKIEVALKALEDYLNNLEVVYENPV